MKPGDKVKMKWMNEYAYGEITIISETLGIKIIFIEDLDYAYYDEKDLIPITEQEYREHERTQSERGS